jgi:membrane protein
LKASLKKAWVLLQDTFDAWSSVRANRLAAALSYYSIFSLGPLFIITIALVGFFFGEMAAEGRILEYIRGITGEQGAEAIQTMIKSAHKPAAGIFATIVSIITLLIGSTGVIIELKDSMNTLWGVRVKPGQGIKAFIRSYIVSIAALFGLSFILMASLILTSVMAGASRFIVHYLPLPESILYLAEGGISLVLLSFLIAAMFKYLPDVAIRWRHVWGAAVATAILFVIGKSLVALYLGKMSFDSIYGAAAFVIVVMVWVYFLAQIFFFGTAFTRIYALSKGENPQPEPGVEFDEASRLPQKDDKQQVSGAA